jgi:hypothetical protein
MDEETPLERARRHVRQGQEHIRRQNEVLAQLRREGRLEAPAQELLVQLELDLTLLIQHLEAAELEFRSLAESLGWRKG